MVKRFNVRVYGILLNEGRVLVSDERIKGKNITKFPGGGLEFGEGIKDCLVREFMEEMNLEVIVSRHFYTTDFFVLSAFDNNSQVISVYYIVNPKEEVKFETSGKLHDHENIEGAQSFRWIEVDKINETDFTLIIDKRVAAMLASEFAAKKNSGQ